MLTQRVFLACSIEGETWGLADLVRVWASYDDGNEVALLSEDIATLGPCSAVPCLNGGACENVGIAVKLP